MHVKDKPMRLFHTVVVLGVAAFSAAHVDAAMEPGTLRCEYLTNPLAVDVARPRLSWTVASDVRGDAQTAYRIVAASAPELLAKDQGDLWDTGKVASDATAQIAYAGRALEPGAACYWKVRVWDAAGAESPWSAAAMWRAGRMGNGNWAAKWIDVPGEVAERRPASLFRKEAVIEKPIRSAMAYISALGVYELQINGQRVGEQILAPEWTDYHVRVQYQTYDVTGLLTRGENAFAATVGDGWYSGRIGLSNIVPNGPTWGHYGKNPKLLMQVEVEFEDGTRQQIVTDGSWTCSLEGPIRRNDTLDGEVQDGRKELPGWDKAGYDDTAWTAANASEIGEKPLLVAQCNEPIRVIEELKPIGLTEPKPGVFVYDLGQNMVGWCRFAHEAPAGTTATFRYGEALNDDGTLYTANLRGAPQTDAYTYRGGGAETFEPHFTYHGFRYVEVTGLPAKPAQDALLGRVFNSSSPEIGAFECSSELLNKLAHNILWTQRANMMSVPTDCPQRDERLGWMGDIQVYSQTAIFNMDMAGFFTKWLQDVRDNQAADGRFPDFAPHPFDYNARFSGVPAWGDAGVFVPWRVYENYGDTRLLETHFEAARRWVDYIHAANPDLIWSQGRNNDYNDWLNADTLKLENWPKSGGAVPPEVLATAFFARSTEYVSRMADVIGRKDDAATYGSLAKAIKAAFCREFVAADGRIKGDTQAGYALALNFEMLPEEMREKAVGHMLAGLVKYNGHISTGIQSTIRMMLELSRAGYDDVAYKLINNRTMPSWGYSIEQGSTTIWERWDGYVVGRGFQDPGMNSLNHWAIGAVGEWMYKTILGINAGAPGYKKIVIRPVPGGGLTYAKGHYDSIRGRIAVDWTLDGGAYALKVSIPANTTATVYVPAASAEQVQENGKPVADVAGIRSVESEKVGFVAFDVGSGEYAFAVKQ
ncbi:MAG: glycoside hydrolase family 78 protein [Candidatus Hydrogenedentes bacterium]|nr:glycoside hydrolase family 78 protein [Candidatus Hydrogenedentota bacterium]